MIKQQTLSPEQAAYVDAKIAYQETAALMSTFAEALPWEAAEQDDSCLQGLCQLIENKDQEIGHNLRAAALIAAEAALLEWGKQQALKVATKAQGKQISYLFAQNAKQPRPSIKGKLIDLCLRLQA